MGRTGPGLSEGRTSQGGRDIHGIGQAPEATRLQGRNRSIHNGQAEAGDVYSHLPSRLSGGIRSGRDTIGGHLGTIESSEIMTIDGPVVELKGRTVSFEEAAVGGIATKSPLLIFERP